MKSRPKELSSDGDHRSQSLLTRREVLAGITSSVALAISPASSKAGAPAQPAAQAKPYDLLIKGGKVIDPSQNIEAERDVAIQGGKIARVEKDISPSQAHEVLDAKGKIVTPGLIDAHVHVFPYIGTTGVLPDPVCVARGATTVVEAGSSGALDVQALRHFVVERSETRVRVLLNVSALGIIGAGPLDPFHISEMDDLRYCDPKLAAKVATENRDIIIGVKLRLNTGQKARPKADDIERLKITREAADEARLPLMIHIGPSDVPLKEFLAVMRQGDVLTHSYDEKTVQVLDSNGKLLPEVVEARKRGVLFDLGPGVPGYSFAYAEKCLAQGFAVDTISSDMNGLNINEVPPNYLPTAATKLMMLGMSLTDVIQRMTTNPARMFDFGVQIGTLKPGAEADVAVFDLQNGNFAFKDGDAKTRNARQMLVPAMTIRGGKAIYPRVASA